MTDMPITIYHNPACGTSRNTLALIREAGHAPTVVEYLKAGWTKETLRDLAARAGVPIRALMRTRGTPAEALGLTDPTASDEAILEAMVEHPILVERPIVATPTGVRLCRPVESVREILSPRAACAPVESLFDTCPPGWKACFPWRRA
jgi:arsenate reductase